MAAKEVIKLPVKGFVFLREEPFEFVNEDGETVKSTRYRYRIITDKVSRKSNSAYVNRINKLLEKVGVKVRRPITGIAMNKYDDDEIVLAVAVKSDNFDTAVISLFSKAETGLDEPMIAIDPSAAKYLEINE